MAKSKSKAATPELNLEAAPDPFPHMFSAGEKVLFAGYGKNTAAEDKVFASGCTLTVKAPQEEDGGVWNLLVVDDSGTEAYVLLTELGSQYPVVDKKALAPAKKVAAKPAKAVKETPPPAPVEVVKPLEHTRSVAKLLKGGATGACSAAMALSKTVAGYAYDMGGILLEIREKGYYALALAPNGEPYNKNQPGFEAWLDDNLGIEYRTAMNYMTVYKVTRMAGLPEEGVKDLKHTKILAMCDLIEAGKINADNWSEWEQKAKTLKGDAFKEAITVGEVNGGVEGSAPRGTTATLTKFVFSLHEDRGVVINSALSLAKSNMPPEEREGATLSMCLDAIASFYLDAHSKGKEG